MSSAIKPYIELCRVSNLPTVWTNVVAAVLLTGEGFSWQNIIILSLSMSLFYSGGMSLNDILDHSIDLVNKPFRPVPSGRVSIKHAYILTISMFAGALVFLLFVPHQKALYAGVLLLTLIVMYDKVHKSRPLSVLLMAACRFMVFITCALAVRDTVGSVVVLAGLLQFIYTLVISIVARHENKRKEGYLFPVIPVMIACMSMIDGILLAVFISPVLITLGIGGALFTILGQRYVRGD